MAKEIWKKIGKGKYSVSNTGNVMSNRRKDSMGRWQGGFLLTKSIGRSGYYTVPMYLSDKQNNYSVHRLVAEAFIPNPENKPTVNHKNSIRTDNRVENLEWNTYSENNAHAYERGNQKKLYGENHHGAKLNRKKVKEIRSKYSYFKYSMPMLAKEYGVSKGAIAAVIYNVTWTQ